MTQRCVSAFAFGSPPKVYTAGVLISDEDTILRTHRHLFEAVEAQVARQESAPTSVTAVATTETASAVPGEPRVRGDVQASRKVRRSNGD